MNSGKTIFSQLMDFLPSQDFRRCVDRYNGNYKLQSFSCWDQFLCMAFAQLTYRESLRDIEACLRSAGTKLYHMGIRGRVSRNTLANANQVRDWRIYADFAQILISTARRLYVDDNFGRRTQSDRLCSGFHDDRSVSFLVSLGALPETQRGCEAAHPAGPAWQHSNDCGHHTQKSSRCPFSRSTRLRARSLLRHGPRICRLRTAVQPQSDFRLLRPSRQTQFRFQSSAFPEPGRIHRRTQRPDHFLKTVTLVTWRTTCRHNGFQADYLLMFQ